VLSSPFCFSSVFEDVQTGEKEFTSRLNGEVNPLQAMLADPGSRSHKTKPTQRALSAFRKGRGSLSPPSYPRNKRKRGVVLFPEPRHLALSDKQRQQYISTLLEKNQKFIQSSAFYRKPTPPNTKKSDVASYMHFLFSYTYIYMYIHIYMCVGARMCIYGV